MEKKMNRREFVKASLATGALVLAGDMVKGGMNLAYGAVKIPEVEKATVTVITDNYYDFTRPNYKIAKRLHTAFTFPPDSPVWNTTLHAEHGLAYHIETVVDGQPHSFLFDYGTDFQGVKSNMELLNIDFKKLEALGLSHDHFDHQVALVELLKSKRELIRAGIPFYVGEQTFVGTFWKWPDGRVISLAALRREDIESLGFVKIVEVKDPTPIVPGAYLTGRIEQVTEYEKIPPGFVAKRGDKFEQEHFIGEQAVVLNAKGKGLIVLSGCAHRGIVNAVKHAQKMTGIEKVYAVMGGFHLTGAKPELIQKTIADIKAVNPEYIVPTHCTGFEAISAFAREMPNQFILNTAGTKYIITG
jgi:7,8-dihydropterin-6-yl-methyl-4-(beta-D-ribofuranosyl)aminobenzene 5'-phosphate synthase